MSNLEEFGNKQIEAFNIHRKLYALQHRPPKRSTLGGADFIILSGLLLVMVASMVVSGFHTIPTILGTMSNDIPDYLRFIVATAAFLISVCFVFIETIS